MLSFFIPPLDAPRIGWRGRLDHLRDRLFGPAVLALYAVRIASWRVGPKSNRKGEPC